MVLYSGHNLELLLIEPAGLGWWIIDPAGLPLLTDSQGRGEEPLLRILLRESKPCSRRAWLPCPPTPPPPPPTEPRRGEPGTDDDDGGNGRPELLWTCEPCRGSKHGLGPTWAVVREELELNSGRGCLELRQPGKEGWGGDGPVTPLAGNLCTSPLINWS